MLRVLQFGSEMNPLSSGIQSLHRLLEVDDQDEEEYSIVQTLDKRLTNNFLAQYQSTFVSDGYSSCR